jgi:uncharacterized protein (DUF58 family)
MTMRYHINLSGTLFVVLTLLVGLAAAQRPNNLVVWGFGVLLAMILVSGVVSARMVRTLRVTRLETRSASSGSPLMVKYLVENLSRKRSVFALRLGEVLTSRSIKERFISRDSKKSDGSYGWLSRIGPGESQVCDSVLPAFRRGVLHLERVRVITAFPFGFIDRRIDFDLDQEILVQPTTHLLKNDLIRSVSQGELGGIGVSARPGPGEDFFSIREFKPGDSIRKVFWKRPQANEDLLVVQRSESTPPRIRVILDLSEQSSKLRFDATRDFDARQLEERAITMAASLCACADKEGLEFGLTVLGFDDRPLPLSRGYWHLQRLLAGLAVLDLSLDRVTDSFHSSNTSERCAVVVVHPARINPDHGPPHAWHWSATRIEEFLDLDATEDSHSEASVDVPAEVIA